MTRRDIPNIITGLRILLVVPIVWGLLHEEFALALVLYAIAGVSDGLDGVLARRYGWTSGLGSVLDPMADKLLQVSSYIVLGFMQHLPGWLVVAVIVRDVVIVSGAFAYYQLFGHYDMAPTLSSKINTALQTILIFTALFSIAVYALPSIVLTVLIYSVLVSVIVSGVAYVYVWTRRAMANSQQPE